MPSTPSTPSTPPVPAVLVWRLGALGDTLLLLPALAALRAAYPAHDLIVAGQPAALAPALWQDRATVLLDAASARFAPLLVGEAPAPGALPGGIDLAVVWSARHAALARGLAAAGIPRVVAVPALPPDRTPVATYYVDTLAPFGVEPAPTRLRAPSAAHAATAAAWWQAAGTSTSTGMGMGMGMGSHHSRPVVLLHPGAGSPLKRWPLRNYLTLAARLREDGLTVVWATGPAEDDLRAALETTTEAAHLLPSLDVAGLAAVLERAAVVVSADCGVAHLTALLGVPAVTLFGPTDPAVWGPPSAHTTVVYLALPCAPCGEIARRCPSRICLRGLSVTAVLAAVRAHLDRVRAGTLTAPLSARTASHPAPSRPAEYRPRRTAVAPPAPLQVATWGGVRNWAARPSPMPE